MWSAPRVVRWSSANRGEIRISIDARTMMIPITTSSSIIVKPGRGDGRERIMLSPPHAAQAVAVEIIQLVGGPDARIGRINAIRLVASGREYERRKIQRAVGVERVNRVV